MREILGSWRTAAALWVVALGMALLLLLRDADRPATPEPAPRAPVAAEPPRAPRPDEPTPADPPPAPEEPETPAVRAAVADSKPALWEIVCLDADGRPIEGLRLTPDDPGVLADVTDAEGRAEFVPVGRRPFVVLPDAPYDWRFRTIRGDATTLRFDDPIPLSVNAADASTREIVATDVGFETPDSIPRLRQGASFWGRVSKTAADGRIHPGGAFGRIECPVSAVATAGRIVVPAWPAAVLRARFLGPDGQPVKSDVEVSARLASAIVLEGRIDPDRDGWAEVGPLPRIPGMDATIRAVWRGFRTESVVSLDSLDRPGETVFRLSTKTVPPGTGRCGGVSIGGRRSRSLGVPGARLDVLAVRSDGRPARACAIVFTGRANRGREPSWCETRRTDDDGRASMDRISEGYAVSVEIREPGVVPIVEDLGAFAPAEHREVLLREPPGQSLELIVVDARGTPVPWARVAASQTTADGEWQWAALDEDGVQDLAPHTGSDGHYVLRGLPPGPVRVTCRFGDWEASGTFRARDAARLVLGL